jgi:adenine deaminase
MEISQFIRVARGEEPAELLLKNARVVKVLCKDQAIDPNKVI